MRKSNLSLAIVLFVLGGLCLLIVMSQGESVQPPESPDGGEFSEPAELGAATQSRSGGPARVTPASESKQVPLAGREVLEGGESFDRAKGSSNPEFQLPYDAAPVEQEFFEVMVGVSLKAADDLGRMQNPSNTARAALARYNALLELTRARRFFYSGPVHAAPPRPKNTDSLLYVSTVQKKWALILEIQKAEFPDVFLPVEHKPGLSDKEKRAKPILRQK
jgi:hypothetical protein